MNALLLLAILAAACAGGAATDASPTPSAIIPTAGDADPPTISWPGENGAFTNARLSMVEHQIAGRGVRDPEVLRAMTTVPRHEFVSDEFLAEAYADHPLPIGYGQTISQPYIVALMTELLQLRGDPSAGSGQAPSAGSGQAPSAGSGQAPTRVLEIGTGSGYQAAVLAELLPEVYTVEIVPELADEAAERLAGLGYENVHVRNADGFFGWEEHAPFDAIIVTAAPDQLPPPLVEQLAPGGRLVIPIGPPGSVQVLWQFVKEANGELTGYRILAVRFVPFTRATESAPQ